MNLHFKLQLLPLELIDSFWRSLASDTNAGTGFIDEIDGRVW